MCVFDNKMTTVTSSSDIKMDSNPSYNITEVSKQNHQYDYVQKETFLTDVKMDSNPSYGRIQDSGTVSDDTAALKYDNTNELHCDVTVQPNPSYSSNLKSTTMVSEDDGYVETDQHGVEGADYLELSEPTAIVTTDNVKITSNPSYNVASVWKY